MATTTKKKIIIDSSVIVKWLLSHNEQNLKQAHSLLTHIKKGQVECFTPELAKYEIGNAILNKKISNDIAELAFSTFYRLPIRFISETNKAATYAYQLAEDHRITYYDAAFMALAKEQDAPLVTDNVKHQAKSK